MDNQLDHKVRSQRRNKSIWIWVKEQKHRFSVSFFLPSIETSQNDINLILYFSLDFKWIWPRSHYKN